MKVTFEKNFDKSRAKQRLPKVDTLERIGRLRLIIRRARRSKGAE